MSDSFGAACGEVNSAGSPWKGAWKNGVCPECRAEMNDPRHPSYRYPFHCCNECGPGYTITLRLPYTRPNTTMAPFQLCERCEREVNDPASRRHRSPIACCPECGPAYWIEPTPPPAGGGDVVHEAVALLREGAILAVKDTCSFRLIARAADANLLQRLRRRKELNDAPLAVMVKDLERARVLAELDAEAEELLCSPSAPTVLARRREGACLSEQVAPECLEIGIMLPRAPIHHLICQELDEPLVVTSANPGGDVVALENEDARESLMDIADYLVLHDLQLHSGCEDSVVRVDAGGPVVLRRSSGFAPKPFVLPRAIAPTLALGGHHESTIAVGQGRAIYVSQHLGHLDTPRAIESFERALGRLLQLWDCDPEFVVFDESDSGFARRIVERFDATPVAVPHHHAHVASVLIEHRFEGDVVGVSLDASTYRIDPTLGRGEFLVGNAASMECMETVPGFRIPGADFAPRDPWRSAMGLLHDLVDPDLALDWAQRHAPDPDAARSAHHMLRNDAGCRRVASFGRLYDAAAALLGLCVRATADGQASRRLAAVAGSPVDDVRFDLPDPARTAPETYFAHFLRGLLRRADHADTRVSAAWAQEALGRWVAARALELARRHRKSTVAAGGGCLSSAWLRHVLAREATAQGVTVLTNHAVPPGDGGLSLGQVWVAANRVGASSATSLG